MVEPQAGIPVLLQPLRGQRHDGTACGHVVSDPMAPLPPTATPTYLVADSALYRTENLPKLAATRLTGLPRVPATVHAAQAVLAQAAPQTLAPRTEGSRSRVGPARSGGVAPRWGLLSSAPRQPQAQRTVDKQWRTRRDGDVKAFQTLGRTALACEAEAHQALAPWAHDVQATLLHASPLCPPPP